MTGGVVGIVTVSKYKAGDVSTLSQLLPRFCVFEVGSNNALRTCL